MGRKYRDAQLTDAVRASRSVRQVLRRLGLMEAGGNYATIKREIQTQGLDVSHFGGQGWRGGSSQPVVPRKPLSQILRRPSGFQSHKLKKRLIAEGLKKHCCENCGLKEWLGQSVPLELDHINGDSTDNRIHNLRLLCPNCHALTETYRGKKLAKRRDETAPS